MSQQLISRSDDLRRLRDEGYDVDIVAAHLVLRDVPYVTAEQKIERGVLVSTIVVSGEATTTPDTHVVMFAGSSFPCDQNGKPIDAIRSGTVQQAIGDTLTVSFSFSSKPEGGYPDYHSKMTAYVAILQGPAQAIDPSVTAKTFPAIPATEEESVFRYLDTASSRAGIGAATRKLEQLKVAIVGLGGTGSYVLDLVAKTPVDEIHLFDGDTLLNHNAFRSPGAASLDELDEKPSKVEYFQARYDAMRRGVIAHAEYLGASNIESLRDADFVFVCIDAGGAKKIIVESLERFGVPFIDVGMGVMLVDDSLGGQVRTTLSVPGHREFLRRRVSLADGGVEDDYDRNVQIADLNALNAAIAVMRWKKHFGFYRDYSQQLNITYTIDTDRLLSEDPDEA
jgi:hypothetical protein